MFVPDRTNGPKLRFPDIDPANPSWEDVHRGAMLFGQACVKAIRNPRTHRLEVGEEGPRSRSDDARVSAAESSQRVAKALRHNREEIAFRICLELIDDLKSVTPYHLAQLTKDAPPIAGDPRYDALIAAIVEDACVSVGAPTPPWVYEETRAVEKWYLTDIESLHEDADRETPPIYRRHGVFILEDELSRA